MAVAYEQGVPTVSPSTDGPVPYQSGRGADAGAFGADIGQGLEKLGQGATTAGKFFGQVAADDASNQFQDYATKLLHGDSSKQVPGPDGQMVPDTGYLGTKGRVALDRRPEVEKALKDEADRIRGQMQTPEQQQQFENFSRRYRIGTTEKVGSHADAQSTEWYTSVNSATAGLASMHIANNADSDDEYLHGREDLRKSYVQNAQLKGGGPEVIADAIRKADQIALKSRLDAIAVKDPSRALAMLDKDKATAGIEYDNLAASFRNRANAQRSVDVGQTAIFNTYTKQAPANGYSDISLTDVGARYGINGSYLQRTHQIENPHNDPNENSAHAQGPFQFIPATAARYGLANRNDFAASADAAARLAADNKASLAHSLGRDPTDAELYLAHQQGAGGATKLLANPSVRSGDLVGDAAIRQNGGDPNAPASAFTSLWTGRFNGSPVAAVQNRKAAAIQEILSNPKLDPEVQRGAITYVNQQIAAQQVAEEQDGKARKVASDAAHGEIVSDIILGKTDGVINRIATNPNLSGPEKETLYNFAVGAGGVESVAQYGPGYVGALNQVLAADDDPKRIVSPTDIIRMGPGGTGQLTKRGVTELLGTMTTIKKQPDQAGVSTVKAKQLEYYKSQMGTDQSFLGPGVPAFKNPKGVNIFNHDFVPAFEAAYSKWIADGKDPMAFLSDNKQMDGIMDRVYPKSQRDADSITAGSGDNPVKEPVPAVPAGADAKAWGAVMKSPPNKADGKPWSMAAWASAIGRLRDDPSQKMMQDFDRKFGPSGWTAKDVLGRLPAAVKKAEAEAEPTLLDRAVTSAANLMNKAPSPVTPVAMGVRG